MRNQGAAGRPSEGESGRRSFAGRRSRRNSTQENESQISIENIGGSTDNLSIVGRNPDKEMRVQSGRKPEAVAVGSLRRGSANHQTFDIRKHSDDGNPDNEVKMFIDNKELEAMEKDEKEDSPKRLYGGRQQEEAPSTPARTWGRGEPPAASSPAPAGDDMNDRLNSVRMKLEERRKRIEEEKRKMEVVMSRQRDKGGSGESALGNSWLSERGKAAAASPSQPPTGPRPADPYSPQPSHKHMNESLHEMQTDIQKLATQQSQIQRMMQSPP